MAIPEFILRKLIVPGSFNVTREKISFRLINNFAPATITSFLILIDNLPLPKEKLLITSSAFSPINAGEIMAEKPLAMPVGIEITVTIEEPDHPGLISLVIDSKEAGELFFSLEESKQKIRYHSLHPSIQTWFSKPKESDLVIDTQKIIGEASPFITGHFIEHLERCIYDGIWTADGSTIREDTFDLIKQLHPSIVRYPGGNFASGYHWEDGIGPKDKRPSRHDNAWQAEESNRVGTDEFLSLCESLHIEPLLVVNDGSGTPEEAARWVSYCNSPKETELGKRRAANGHVDPYNVKYWGIGNEVWGPWQIGNTSAEEYSQRLVRFVRAMKKVDDTIKIIAVGNNPLTDESDDPAAEWNRTVLQNAADYIDYISWHIYQPEKEGWKENYDPLNLHLSVCAGSCDMENIITRVEKQIKQHSPGKTILQAIDEWNLWLPPRDKNVSMHQTTYTLRDACYVTSVLATFYRACNTVGMANVAQMVNVLPLIQTNNSSAIATSIFFPFLLFNQMLPFVLHSSIICETYNCEGLDASLSAHLNVGYLDALATCDESKQTMSVVMVNRYPRNKLKVHLNLAAGDGWIPISSLKITAPRSESFNTFEKPSVVKLMDGRLPKKSDSGYEVVIEPSSIYYVLFRK